MWNYKILCNAIYNAMESYMYSEGRNNSGSHNYRHRRGPGGGFGGPGGGFGGPGGGFFSLSSSSGLALLLFSLKPTPEPPKPPPGPLLCR